MTEKPLILTLQAFAPGLEAGLDAAYEVARLHKAADPDALLSEIGPRVAGVVTGAQRGLPKSMWEALPSLRIVAVHGVGLDAVDLDIARARGVAVTTTPDVLTEDVADLAIGLWLSVQRRIPRGDAYVRAGAWTRREPLPLARRASGRRVGVLGLGQIGRAIAARAEPFATEIAYHNRKPAEGAPYAYRETPLALAEWADVLFLAVSGSAPLIGAAELAALGPDGVLVNVARGAVVNEAALVAALSDGTLGAAALDVFAHEPAVPEALLGLPNVLLQPHVGSATEEARAAMGQVILAALAAHLA